MRKNYFNLIALGALAPLAIVAGLAMKNADAGLTDLMTGSFTAGDTAIGRINPMQQKLDEARREGIFVSPSR